MTVPLVPASVRAVRVSTAEALTSFGLAPDSSLTGAALLVVSELVTNAVRHAERSPDAEVVVTVAAGQLVIGVRDLDSRVIDLAAGPTGRQARVCGRLRNSQPPTTATSGSSPLHRDRGRRSWSDSSSTDPGDRHRRGGRSVGRDDLPVSE
ncbi:ATP-binding protein [Streptomyces sp. NBC_01221]|uniref:ATP-binding protein n=1 Tax=Streptomyces sp. NBC_01221 TaxID=2903782 RepID=UPI002254E46A|nr:ATP-binding protein [Streptomyces sp. NBC_01221]MCX4791371.1 ATP-binding protein [Streptomyces sp. NBC_01221]